MRLVLTRLVLTRPVLTRPVQVLLPGLLLVLAVPFSGPVSPAYAGRVGPVHGRWPLDPRPEVVRGFDPPVTRWGAGHRGVDLAGRPGQSVRTARAGRVSFAGTLAGRGVVVVAHGATRTTYEPVDAVVHVGDTLAAGATIGRLQLFGSHCFPAACLHWGLIEGRDHYLDPLTLVGAGPVRLLPLHGPLDGLPALSWAVGPAVVGPRGFAALRGDAPR